MARKKSRQTFEKMKREQKVREKRERKEERKEASRIAKALGLELPPEESDVDGPEADASESESEPKALEVSWPTEP